MWVSIAVVTYIVACFVNFFDFFGIFVYPVTAKKECGLYIVFIKYIKQGVGVVCSPGGIKAYGKLFGELIYK